MTESDRGAQLAQRFVALADTLVDDFDLIELLDNLVRTCVDILDVTTAGLLILDGRGTLHPVAASTEATRVLELLQLQSNEGPCLECVRTGEAVTIPDLSVELDRWPRFAPAALAHGFGSVHALPMRLRKETIGSLNLFTAGDGAALSGAEKNIAQALADVATIGILQQRTVQRSSELAQQLQQALDTRIVIEQAKGVLAEFGGIDIEQAFGALRSYARSSHLKIGDVALRLARGLLPPSEVVLARARPGGAADR